MSRLKTSLSFNDILETLSIEVDAYLSSFNCDLFVDDDTTYQHLMVSTYGALMAGNWMKCRWMSTLCIDVVWERLNTGHWSTVLTKWRSVYTYFSVIKAISEFAIAYLHYQGFSLPEYSAFDLSITDEERDLQKQLDAYETTHVTPDSHVIDFNANAVRASIQEYGEYDRAAKVEGHNWANPAEKEIGFDESYKPIEKCNSVANRPCYSYDVALMTCDSGLIMGEPCNDYLINRLASSINSFFIADVSFVEKLVVRERVAQLDPPILDENKEIARVEKPSLMNFYDAYLKKEKPIIITGAIDFWPALGRDDERKKWSTAYIKFIAGDRSVPIEIGSQYTEDEWRQEIMTITEFIRRYITDLEQPDVGYLAQHELFEQIRELANDFSIPDYCCLDPNPLDSGHKNILSDGDVRVNAWFGSVDTVTPLHTDAKHNLFAQVFGTKYIRIYHKDYTDCMYAYTSSLLHNTSRVEAENPNKLKFPKFVELTDYIEMILQPGEMVYIPAGHWHYVRSLSTSFSISFWWK